MNQKIKDSSRKVIEKLHTMVPTSRTMILIGIAVAVVMLLGFVWWSFRCWHVQFWDWLRAGAEAKETNAATLRNLLLGIAAMIGAFIGIPLAVWRNATAHKQVNQQHEATQQSDRQHRQSLSQSRFSRAVEHLKDDDPVVKRGGVMTLARLVHDEDYPNRQDVLDMLSQFIKLQSPLSADGKEGDQNIDPLAQIAIRNVAEKALGEELRLDIRDTNLAGAILIGANLAGVDLAGAKLSHAAFYDANLICVDLSCTNLIGADFIRAKLSRVDFICANLSDARLTGANLTDANLSRANLSAANFYGTNGLTQAQLDSACQDPNGVPPRELPEGLTWDEYEAVERWKEMYMTTEK